MTFDAVKIRRKVALLDRLKYQFEQLGRDNVVVRQAQMIAIQENFGEEHAWLIAAVHLAEQNRIMMQTEKASIMRGPCKEGL